MKTCFTCKENKNDDAFYFDNRNKKLFATCRSCQNARRKERYQQNLELTRNKLNSYRQTSNGKYGRLKEDVRKRCITLTISKELFIHLTSLPCYYCDNKLGTKVKYGVGLDRLDNNLGYEENNVVPCCSFCNIVKGYILTSQEMKLVANLLINERKNKSPIDVAHLKSTLTKSRKHPLKTNNI